MADYIAAWKFSIPALGYNVTTYTYEFGYAGGFALVGLGDDASMTYYVYNLGGGLAALMTGDMGENRHYYWNAHYGNALILESDDYTSKSVGSEQKFKMRNLGHGLVTFQATGGEYAGQYLTGAKGGWYPQEFHKGKGSLTMAGGSPSDEAKFLVHGDMLPILLITRSGVDLDLTGAKFAGVDLTDVDMTRAVLQRADLSQVKLSRTNFTDVQLQGAVLDGLVLAEGNFAGADFSDTDLTRIAPSQNSALAGAHFVKSGLKGVMLSASALQNADFSGADLTGADLTNADLSGANFDGASLGGTDLRGANLEGTSFANCDLTGTIFDPEPRFRRDLNGPRTSFKDAKVPYQVISDDWSYLDLTGATVVNLPDSIEGLRAQYAVLPERFNLQGKKLQGADFSNCVMYSAQLQKADLQGARLKGARLKGANLTGANLTLVDLEGAYLIAEPQTGTPTDPSKPEAAVLADAFLINTNLSAAYCDGVDFSGVKFLTNSGVSPATASAKGAFMNLAKFSGKALLAQAAFDGAQLSGADFSEAVMVGASFKNAVLTPSSTAPFAGASFTGADIRGINAAGANMDGLDMKDATYSVSPGECQLSYTDFYQDDAVLDIEYGATKLGNMSANTTCPDGSNGPCRLPPATDTDG